MYPDSAGLCLNLKSAGRAPEGGPGTNGTTIGIPDEERHRRLIEAFFSGYPLLRSRATVGRASGGAWGCNKVAAVAGWYRSVADLAPSSRIPAVTEEALSIVSERRGSTHYVAPSGELDIATVQLLEGALLAVEQTDVEMIVLDLSSLAFIDSNGLRLVLDLNDRCGGAADRLRVIAGSPAVERLLDIVGLRERLPLIAP
jgi:anti-anti-sigma factor